MMAVQPAGSSTKKHENMDSLFFHTFHPHHFFVLKPITRGNTNDLLIRSGRLVWARFTMVLVPVSCHQQTMV